MSRLTPSLPAATANPALLSALGTADAKGGQIDGVKTLKSDFSTRGRNDRLEPVSGLKRNLYSRGIQELNSPLAE
jgi:hypothetical protein